MVYFVRRKATALINDLSHTSQFTRKGIYSGVKKRVFYNCFNLHEAVLHHTKAPMRSR